MPPEHGPEASPAPEPDVTPASSAGPDVTSESSPGTEAAAPAEVSQDVKEAPAPSLLDVVRDAVEQKAEPEPAAEASSAEETAKADPEVDVEAAPAAETETFEGLSFAAHPRFRQILSQRNLARDEVDKLKGPAESYRKIETFLATTGVSNEEMVNLFKVGALIKSDPEGALKELSPLLADLYERTGAFLPDDLKTDVEEGKITEDRARELAKARASKRESERQAKEATERADTVVATTEAERQNGVLETTLADWEAGKKGKDPDFAAKEEFIADRCRALIAEKGNPKSPAEMIAILDQAHRDVTAALRKALPAKEETKRAPSSSPSPSATAAPKTLLEAITIAASQGR
jgi:hypothetical protein